MLTRRLPHVLFGFFLLFCIAGRTISAQTAAPAPPTVVFMTDFGVVDDSVALCKGVMYSIAPELRIVDLTHEVTPFSILDGARFLYGASPYFPCGHGVRDGHRSRGGKHAQSGGGEDQARPVFRAARQRPDDAGPGPRRNRSGARDHEPRLDDRRCPVIHFPRTRYFFSGRRASGPRRGLDRAWDRRWTRRS